MKTRTQSGFTLVEIMIVVAVIGLLASIALPSLMRARSRVQRNTCLNNLRHVSNAKDQYALEFGLNFGDPIAEDQIAPYMRAGMPECPLGGAYIFGTIGENPLCPNFDPVEHDAQL